MVSGEKKPCPLSRECGLELTLLREWIIPVTKQVSYSFFDIAIAIAIAKSLQSCLTLCDPIDGSPPGFPIPGILQARTLEWVAISLELLGWTKV